MGVALRVLAGFTVAVLCTPAGVSGAFLLLPVQVLLFGAPSPAVSATNLLYNVTATPAGAMAFRRQGRLDRSLTLRLVAGTVPGVLLGVVARSTVLADADRFAPVAAVVLIGLGARLLADRQPPAEAAAPAPVIPATRLALVGLAAGAVGGVYGLGGAALVVPWLVSVEKVPLRLAAPPGLVVTLVTSVLGLLAFVVADLAGLGDASGPEWAAGLALGAGGAAGAVVGVRLQPRLPVAFLRVLLAVAALTAGLRLLL
jgi:uncharacterized membrane protein YfcA